MIGLFDSRALPARPDHERWVRFPCRQGILASRRLGFLAGKEPRRVPLEILLPGKAFLRTAG